MAKQKATFSLPVDLLAEIRKLAMQENRPISRQVELALRGHLATARNSAAS